MVVTHLLIVLFCSFVSSVYMQEVPQVVNTFPSTLSLNRVNQPPLGLPGPIGARRKLCPKRRSNDQGNLISPASSQKSGNDIEHYYDCNLNLNDPNGAPQQYATDDATGFKSKPVLDVLKDCAENIKKSGNNAANVAPNAVDNAVPIPGAVLGADPLFIKGSRRSMDEPNAGVADEEVDRSGNILMNVMENPNAAEVEDIAYDAASRRTPDSSAMASICYACSSATNPSCWAPDSRTTIKYCRSNQQCVMKVFGESETLTVIRDCAESCTASSIPGVEPRYTRCKICKEDLCNVTPVNGAFTNTCSLAFVLLATVVKYTL